MSEMLIEFFKDFWKDEEGIGTLEILLIIAVIVAIALIFRERIISWIEGLLERIGDDIEEF